MKIIKIKELAIPDVKVIKFARFADHRGYFTEQFRKSDLLENSGIEALKGANFVQANESFSNAGTMRGLHFQWNPYMGKLVRTLSGHLVDFVLDIRKGSSTEGKIIAYNMPYRRKAEYAEWIWVPPGFAHGTLLLKKSLIEYFCTGEYSPDCEAGISPLAPDLDWSLCEQKLKAKFDEIATTTGLMTEKDKNAFSLGQWMQDERSANFVFGKM